MAIDSLFSVLKLSDLEKDIYKILIKDGHITADEVAHKLGISDEVAYEGLKSLSTQGLLEEQMEEDVKKFHIKSSEKLEFIINQKQEEINEAKDALSEIKE